MTGEPTGTLRFHAGPPVSPRTRYWIMTRWWVAERLLADDTVAAEPLAPRRSSPLPATLLAVPNTALDLLTDPGAPTAGRAEPATLRRAVEFIDANAQREIDLAEIADAARIGVRGLQVAFRRHRDQTPLQ